ncbi:MAG: glutamine--fructose-6-phosphate transaminase (isomerizing) [Myxococcota bacterium]
MCGIVGVTGHSRAAEEVLDGLRKLEYRGYDSAGIAAVHDGELEIRRRKGKLSELTDLLRAEPLSGETAIGHTRWATHGRPSDENAHPHRAGDLVVVHNGIIENFLELRAELSGQGVELQSETDTEIVAHLIARESGPLAERIRKALRHVEGAYAIAVLSAECPDEIVVAKNASPLVIGVRDDLGLIASDIPALLAHTRDVIILDEGELAVVKPGSVRIERIDDGEKIERSARRIDWSPVMAEKAGHKHFMHKEIHEQPRAVIDTLRGRLLASGDDVNLDGLDLDRLAKASRVIFTACGTSWHACLVGRLLLEDLASMACEVELASELRYRNPLLGPDTLVVAVSQSGETADTLAAIRSAREKGSRVVSVVNVVDSSIARESDDVFYTHAGPEIGVASTKAFITQVTALALLAAGVGRRRGFGADRANALLDELRHVPGHIESVLKHEEHVIEIAHRIVHARSALFVGRGYGFPVALEGALKLKEVSYIHAEGYAAGEMKHGPIALVEPGVPVVVVANQGPLYDKVVSNLQEVRARDGDVIAVATEGDTRIQELTDCVLWTPPASREMSPIVSTIPLQLLAYHVADLRGTDVDQPRNLAKSVTVE